MSKEIKNARIESTMLGIEDHGILTFWLNLDYGGSGQGFGGYALDSWDAGKGRRVGTAYGAEALLQVLAVVGVERWEQLPGKSVRVEADNGHVYRLGHYLKEQWLDLKALAAELPDGAR